LHARRLRGHCINVPRPKSPVFYFNVSTGSRDGKTREKIGKGKEKERIQKSSRELRFLLRLNSRLLFHCTKVYTGIRKVQSIYNTMQQAAESRTEDWRGNKVKWKTKNRDESAVAQRMIPSEIRYPRLLREGLNMKQQHILQGRSGSV
jgi:hypothetical protein